MFNKIKEKLSFFWWVIAECKKNPTANSSFLVIIKLKSQIPAFANGYIMFEHSVKENVNSEEVKGK